MKAYCPKCEELRTDNGDDSWGFMWNAGVPQCQRCGFIVEIRGDEVEDDGDWIDLDDQEDELGIEEE